MNVATVTNTCENLCVFDSVSAVLMVFGKFLLKQTSN